MKVWPVVFVLLGIVLVSGCTTQPGPATTKSNCPPGSWVCPNGGRTVIRYAPGCELGPCALPETTNDCLKKEGTQRDVCYNDYAMYVAGDVDVCGSIADSTLKNYCYSHFSETATDISTCGKVPSDQYTKCIGAVSRFSKDPGLCSPLSGNERAFCMKSIAINTLDKSLCDEAAIPGYPYDVRFECLQEVANGQDDPTFCDSLGFGHSQEEKNECYYRTGQCEKYLLPERVGSTGNITRMRESCYTNHAAYVARYDPVKAVGICLDHVSRPDECLGSVAFKMDTMDSCLSYLGEYSDECYYAFIFRNPDPSYCSQIKYNVTRNGCYMWVSMILSDPAYCEMIPESDYLLRNDCAGNVSRALGNASICNLFSNTTVKSIVEKCYHGAAIAAGDPKQCNLITEEWTRQKCISDAGYYS